MEGLDARVGRRGHLRIRGHLPLQPLPRRFAQPSILCRPASLCYLPEAVVLTPLAVQGCGTPGSMQRVSCCLICMCRQVHADLAIKHTETHQSLHI